MKKSTPTLNNGSFVKNGSMLIVLLLLISAAVWLSFLQFRSPEVVPKEVGFEEFSAGRALEDLKEFAVKPHPLGSEEHDRVRDYLMTSLKNLGVSPEIQKLEGDGAVENIVARIRGEDSSSAVMVVTHYDSVPEGPGAADAGSAVAAILETVRILVESEPLKNDVIVLISDGEEVGLLGAKAFVEFHPWAKDVGVALNFEARGSMGPSILFETNEGNERMISEFIKGSPNPIAHSFLYDLYQELPNETDFTVFKNAGMYGLNFAFVEGFKHYHTPNDTVENLSVNSLQHHGENMLSLVRHFGNMNLVAKEDGDNIFFNVIGHKVVTYSEKVVMPLMVFLIIGFIFTFVHGYKRKKLTILGTLAGIILFILSLLLSYEIGELAKNILTNIFTETVWIIQSEMSISHPVFVGFIFIVFSIITLIDQFVGKKINFFNLAMGAWLGWLILVMYASFQYPGSSYIFAWPLLFGLTGMNLLFLLKNAVSIKGYSITMAFAALAILITVPALYVVYILVTIEYMSILLVLTALLSAFIMPIIATLRLKVTAGLSCSLFLVGIVMIAGKTMDLF
ncbi:M20/M25/M40 family metallo-hydrolase [Bacillus sp. Hm123]|uniref:M20/M25/M40 family metallo-hydrolase n=1 Tax=Bacillus sp. Hm123 TaxID=3450745 RepID=UPI003F444085